MITEIKQKGGSSNHPSIYSRGTFSYLPILSQHFQFSTLQFYILKITNDPQSNFFLMVRGHRNKLNLFNIF